MFCSNLRYREIFNNQCLYTVKLHGGLVGVWDIDEFLMPVSGYKEPKYNLQDYSEISPYELNINKRRDVLQTIEMQLNKLNIDRKNFCTLTLESVSPSSKIPFFCFWCFLSLSLSLCFSKFQ